LKEVIKCADSKNQVAFSECKSVKRDPHNSNLLAFSYGKRFELVDLRTPNRFVMQNNQKLHSSQAILDLDYNPIKVNTLATAGQDSTIRFWDLRKVDSGLCLHSYNPTDQMTSFSSSGPAEGKISVTSSNRFSSPGLMNANALSQ
jgi:WD40 repeat protein